MAALLDKDIIEFQRLYRRHFCVDITKEQALEKGLRLIRLIEAVSRVAADEQRDAQKPAQHP